MSRTRGRRPRRARMQPARTRPSARARRRTRRQSRLGRLFPSSGLRTQVRVGLRLARSTPGLSMYLGGGLAVWLLTRAMEGHGLATSSLGALGVGIARLLGLAL